MGYFPQNLPSPQHEGLVTSPIRRPDILWIVSCSVCKVAHRGNLVQSQLCLSLWKVVGEVKELVLGHTATNGWQSYSENLDSRSLELFHLARAHNCSHLLSLSVGMRHPSVLWMNTEQEFCDVSVWTWHGKALTPSAGFKGSRLLLSGDFIRQLQQAGISPKPLLNCINSLDCFIMHFNIHFIHKDRLIF